MLRKVTASVAPFLIAALVLLSPLAPFITIGGNPAFAQQQKGAYIDQARFIHTESENLALEQVKSGALDAYYFRIPLELAPDAARDPRVTVYDRVAGSATLLINPAPQDEEGMINPFQLKEVRYALNYLIDREGIVGEYMNGYGSPMADPFGIYSPEYLTVIDVVESFGFRHNPQLADRMISDALVKAGAVKSTDSGTWTFAGKPITVKILIRQDDLPRKLIGEDLASKLEKTGFVVEKEYGDLNKANPIVYGSDPQDFKWHIYTEGFAGTSVFVKYNPITTGQMYGPWQGRMPGAQNEAFWYYQNATLDEITQKIFFFDFNSQAERDELVRMATKMGIQESVRIFVAQRTDPFVASSDIEGMVNDFGAGITSKYSLLNARPPEGGSLDIGVKQIHQGVWNPIGGVNDAYSRDIYFSIVDTGTFRNPYTGEIIPLRTDWTEVSTMGPDGKLEVPEDAIKWDVKEQRWKQVGTEEASASKATFKLLYSNWHNGIPMDRSDLLYTLYFAVEWGTDEGEGDATKDAEYTAQTAPGLKYINGSRFTAPDVVESYTDIWHYDDTEIADSATIWAIQPWEITAATERLVVEGRLAYSRSEATVRNAEWLDQILESHAIMIRDELEQMKQENFVPAALADFVTVEEAKKRYDASAKWIEDHRHAVIGNGAFYLDSYNPAGGTITIKAFRDPSYPYEVGHWAAFERPMLAGIARVDVPRSIAIGQAASATVSVTVDGQPSNDAVVKYYALSQNGVVASGDASADTGSAGQFKIDLAADDTSRLTPGPNQLKIFAYSNEALRPVVFVSTILASGSPVGGSGGNDNGGGGSNNNNGGTPPAQQPPQQSGCLIATAAFGSELTPQVQYLRNFRQNYILSTASGSAFMNAFNSVYYSFSPQVADYERGQPWLQAAVKAALYPLFGILNLSERAHFAATGGEAGAIAAGAVASVLIGAVYLWPATAFSSRLQSRFGSVAKIALAVLAVALALTVAGIAIGAAEQEDANVLLPQQQQEQGQQTQWLLSISTSLLVLSMATLAAMAAGRLARKTLTAVRACL